MNQYSFFTSNELKPTGWMKRQLEIQAKGLSGNLDLVWPDIRDSQWIGGDREGWERVPYWLDGFIPLAYLLENEDMIARAKKYVDKIIENQKEDGWICPNGATPIEKYDTWAVLLISKVLVVYYECSRDERIPAVVYRMMKNYYELLSAERIKLFAWGAYRWFEGFVALNFLAERHPDEEWIAALARLLETQGIDYRTVRESWKVPLNKWTLYTHVVNLAMMYKSEAVSHKLLGKSYEDLAEDLYTTLMTYNGTVTGTMTGDECLSGTSPIQGTELCSVVEMMYSFELLYAATGDNRWAERLERIAFNALPATISDNMWAHQYDQMTNQIDATPFPGRAIFRTNNGEAHVFGLEPHYGCCTSNFNQGWPKLALSAFMRAENGIVCAVPLPSSLNTVWKDTGVSISLDTDYPFRNTMTYTVCADADTDMTLRIRIPSFAEELTLNGKALPTQDIVISGFAKGETRLTVSFRTTPKLSARPGEMFNAECGSLVFALPVKAEISTKEYTRKDVERKFPYCDYLYKGTSDWNYGFADDTLEVEYHPIDEIPFASEAPAITLRANLSHVDWGLEDGFETVCAKSPMHTEALDAPTSLRLYPYGCAKLRMTEMPKVK